MAEDTAKKRRGEGKTILVVDDERIVCEIISDILEDAGYNVVSARDGDAGWEEYKKTKPDLVIADYKMPNVDGITLLSWIRKEDSSIPVVFISGFVGRDRVLQAGADAFISKPFKVEEIVRMVDKLLAKGAQRLENERLKNLISFLTDRNKELQQKIDKLSSGSKRGSVAKDDAKYEAIIGSFAHSLKGEFLHIGAAVRNLRESVVKFPDAKEEYDLMERSVEYARLLLLRLLGYLELGSLETEPVDAANLLKKAQVLAEPRLLSNIRLKIKIDSRIRQRTVSVNPDQLLLVLMELVNNSKNALKEKPGTIELRLQGRIRGIALSVKDDGPGIPRGTMKNLFKKEVRSESGLGVGLFLCNKLVSAMGGKMSVKSSSNSGTTVTILLPKASEKERP